MLRLLFRLWWLQQRRSFTWKDAVVGGYLIFVYVMVGLGFYFGATLDGEELFENGTPDALCAILVLTMLVPDIILKVVMKHDSTAMDDYLKSRPVPEKVWNRFLLLTNLANFWNYVMPVLMLPMLFWMLSVPQAIVGYLLMQAFSFINGIYVTCYYKTTDWMLRWPLLLGWIGMGAILTAYLVCFAWMPGFLINIGMAVWAVLIITGLLFYLYNLKIYNEHKQKTSRFRWKLGAMADIIFQKFWQDNALQAAVHRTASCQTCAQHGACHGDHLLPRCPVDGIPARRRYW